MLLKEKGSYKKKLGDFTYQLKSVGELCRILWGSCPQLPRRIGIMI